MGYKKRSDRTLGTLILKGEKDKDSKEGTKRQWSERKEEPGKYDIMEAKRVGQPVRFK